MMLIFAQEVKWNRLFLQGKRADGQISRHAGFWVKRGHQEWLDLKAKTRRDLICPLLFPLFKDNSWLHFHCISKDSFKRHISAPGICCFQNTEQLWSFVTPFRAVNFRGSKQQTQKASRWIFRCGDTWKYVTPWRQGTIFFLSLKKWDCLTLLVQCWAGQTPTDLTVDAK